MEKGEKVIKIAARLYEVRSTAKTFLGAKYQEKIKPYIHILQETMKANKENETEALLRISKTNMYRDSEFAPMMFISASVEVMEENPAFKS